MLCWCRGTEDAVDAGNGDGEAVPFLFLLWNVSTVKCNSPAFNGLILFDLVSLMFHFFVGKYVGMGLLVMT